VNTPLATLARRPLWAHSIGEAAAAIREDRNSASEYVDACIGRAAQVEGFIHSYIHLAADDAREQARNADASDACHSDILRGLPFAVKATYDVAGWPSGSGSYLRHDRIAARDAQMVATLRGRGAICLGLLNTWEYGTGNGGEYFDLPHPPARNPWDTARFTGGSSSGCGASVIAGTSMFALGSDTTGSVRLPAGATGAVGLIPTPGRFSLDGILPNCYSLDTPGTFTRTAEDAAILFNVLASPGVAELPAPSELRRCGIAGMKIAVLRDPGPGFPQAAQALSDAFEAGLRMLEGLGASLSDVRLPVSAAECLAVTRLIGPVESASIHESELRQRPSQMGFALRDKLMAGSLVRAVDYLAAQRRRAVVADELRALMAGFEALITFGTLHLPPLLGVEPEMTAFTVETMLTPFNLAGLPALVQCTGFSTDPRPLPLHWQIVGRAGGEAAMLRLAIAYEGATAWRDRLPEPTPHAAPSPQMPPPGASPVPMSEVIAFAARHGLNRLDPTHLERMRDLVEPVARTGHVLNRVTEKERRPAHASKQETTTDHPAHKRLSASMQP
jgi:aspartyl-tRNA(Asn)/glutamyl-tRNA(Gln) amidotransferase subunit A